MLQLVSPTLYSNYIFWRRQGLRATTAYGMAKYGLSFALDYLSDGK
jgi:hypothetical protein